MHQARLLDDSDDGSIGDSGDSGDDEIESVMKRNAEDLQGEWKNLRLRRIVDRHDER